MSAVRINRRLWAEIVVNIVVIVSLVTLGWSRDHADLRAMQAKANAIIEARKDKNIADPEQVPSARIDVHPTPDGGWNLLIAVERFGFAASADSINEHAKGYMHLIVDGHSVTRLATPFYYFPRLANGDHLLTLFFEDRFGYAYATQGKPIVYNLTLRVAGSHHELTAP
jgi:hypothetical protein